MRCTILLTAIQIHSTLWLWRNRVGLYIQVASDFHGATKPKIDMGTGMGKLAVPYEILEKIRGERNG